MKTRFRLPRRGFLASVLGLASLRPMLASVPEGTTHKFKLKAAQPRSITFAGDHIVIAADRALLFHRLDGALIRETPMPRPVRTVCADARGGLIITFSDQVARVTEKGTLELLGESFGKNAALTGIAVSEDGRLFAADSGQRVIWRLDAAGKVLGSIKPGAEGFTVPRAFFPIAWQDGHLIIAEPGRHQIHRYSAEGVLVAKWGARSREAEGFAGCCNPVALAVAGDSIITAERGQVRVKRFDTAGHLTAQLATPEQFTAQVVEEDGDLFGCEGGLLDVAASNEGRVVVLDRSAGEVHVLS